MLSNHIEDIITAIKAKPNSLHKNKALSHAQDMLAHVKLLEMEERTVQNRNVLTEPQTAFVHRDLVPDMNAKDFQFGIDFGGCICPEGAIDASCPVHRARVR